MTSIAEGQQPESSLLLCVGPRKEFCSVIYNLQYELHPERVVRLIRGSHAQSRRALFDEFAAALQFPCYFGENWNAFDECIADLEWLPGKAYFITIVDGPLVLREEPQDLEVFARIMRNVSREWFDTHGLRFQTFLQCEETEVDALRRSIPGSLETVDLAGLKSFVTRGK